MGLGLPSAPPPIPFLAWESSKAPVLPACLGVESEPRGCFFYYKGWLLYVLGSGLGGTVNQEPLTLLAAACVDGEGLVHLCRDIWLVSRACLV